MSHIRWIVGVSGLAFACTASAQVPDLVNTFDAGTRSSGSAGALRGALGDPTATFNNPAGLGYIKKTTVSASMRNFTETRSLVTGDYDAMNRESVSDKGSNRLSQVSIAIPLVRNARNRGTLGISYNVGGYLDEIATGPQNGQIDVGGGFGIKNFAELRRLQTSYWTFAYANTNAEENLAYSIGLVVADQKFRLEQVGTFVDSNGQQISNSPSFPNVDDRTVGVGVTAGVMYSPPQNLNQSFWLSTRSPIAVNAGSDAAKYGTIPGEVLLGTAIRFEGFRVGRKDYIVAAAQGDFTYGGSGSVFFDPGTPWGFNLGVEYNVGLADARLPLRLGYASYTNTGQGFEGRRVLTYGVGYTAPDGRYSFDIAFAKPSEGPTDTIFSATYRF